MDGLPFADWSNGEELDLPFGVSLGIGDVQIRQEAFSRWKKSCLDSVSGFDFISFHFIRHCEWRPVARVARGPQESFFKRWQAQAPRASKPTQARTVPWVLRPSVPCHSTSLIRDSKSFTRAIGLGMGRSVCLRTSRASETRGFFLSTFSFHISESKIHHTSVKSVVQ